MRVFHARGDVRRARECVENSPLSVAVQQRLRFVLAVEIDELASNLGEHAGIHRRTVDPRSRAPRSHLAFENDDRPVDVDAALVEQRLDLWSIRDVELALDDRAIGARANDVGARPLAEQQAERPDDDGFAGAGFARQHIESWRQRKRQRFYDREILDPQLGEHLRSITVDEAAPAQLLSQRREEARARESNDQHSAGCATHAERLASRERSAYLAINGN